MADGLGRSEVVEVAAERIEACVFIRCDGYDLNLFCGDCATGTVLWFWPLPFWIGFHPAYRSKKGAGCPVKSSKVGGQQLTPLGKMTLPVRWWTQFTH